MNHPWITEFHSKSITLKNKWDFASLKEPSLDPRISLQEHNVKRKWDFAPLKEPSLDPRLSLQEYNVKKKVGPCPFKTSILGSQTFTLRV